MIGRRQEERSRDVAENRLLGSNIEKEDVFAVITLNNSEIESRPTTYTKEDRHKELCKIYFKRRTCNSTHRKLTLLNVESIQIAKEQAARLKLLQRCNQWMQELKKKQNNNNNMM